MRYDTRAELEARLKQATKKVEYYKRIAEVAGNTRLREAEELSQLVAKYKRRGIALQESEEKLRNVLEHSNNLFYSHTPDHILTYLSPQIEQTLGYTAEEAMVKWTELGSDNPINEEGFKKTVAAIESGKTQPPYELELVHKNGQKVLLEIREAPVVENGKTVAIVGAATDITDRKQAEKALRESEERFRSLSESSPMGVWHTDKEGRVLYTNKRWQEITGLTLKQSLGVGWSNALHPDDKKPVLEEWDKCVREEKGSSAEFRFLSKSGDVKWVYTKTAPIRSETGQVIGHVGSNEDITDRKQAEKTLRKEKDFIDAALNSQMDTFFVFDPSTGKAIRWNKAFRDVVGYTDEEIASLPAPASYYSPIDLKRAIPFVEKVMTEGTGTIELELICKDGRRVPTEYRVAALHDQDGKPEYLISIGRDITKRKQAEEALKEKKAQLGLKAKSLEEVNTTLRVLLKEREKDKTDLEKKVSSNVKDLVLPYIERIKKSSLDHIQKSCIDILESNLEEIVSPFSRKLSSRYLRLTPTEIRVANLVKEGKTTKEIAEFMNLSPRTVESHRNNIREKLGIKKSETNLRTYLLSM